MSLNLSEEINRILDGIRMSGIREAKKMFIINGIFGTGKSYLIRNLFSEIENTSAADAVLYFNHNDDRFISGFLKTAEISVINPSLNAASFNKSELSYIHSKVFDIINNLLEKNPVLSDKILYNLDLKSHITALSEDISTDEFIEELTAEVEKKSHIMMLTDLPNLASEALIADLMAFFYPDQEKDTKDEENNPKKVIVLLDNYDGISDTVNFWLAESFIDYCNSKTFSDFKYYDISNAGEDKKVLDYIDFRFVAAEREPRLSLKEEISGLGENLQLLELKPFSQAEIKSYMEKHGIFPDESPEMIEKITYGIPSLLDCWIDAAVTGANGRTYSLIYEKAYMDIVSVLSAEQRFWLECASFLDIFNSDGLRCFRELNGSHDDIFKALSASKEFTKQVSENFISVHPYIKNFISKSIKNNEPDRAEVYSKISSVYNNTVELFKGLEGKEKDAARNLAYLDSFDYDNLIGMAYQNDADLVKSVIEKKPDWFERDKHFFTIKPDIKENLTEFNKLLDFNKYEDKLNLINNIKGDYRSTIESSIYNKELELPALDKELTNIEKQIITRKQKYSENQTKFMDLENRLIELRKKLSLFAPGSYISYAGLNFLIAIVVLAAAFAVPKFFGNGNNGDAMNMSKDILIIITVIFSAMGFLHIGRLFYMRSKKEERLNLQDQLDSILVEKANYLEEMNKIKEENDTSHVRIFEINKKLKTIREELKELKEILNSKL